MGTAAARCHGEPFAYAIVDGAGVCLVRMIKPKDVQVKPCRYTSSRRVAKSAAQPFRSAMAACRRNCPEPLRLGKNPIPSLRDLARAVFGQTERRAAPDTAQCCDGRSWRRSPG